jgi:hypothetical protein
MLFWFMSGPFAFLCALHACPRVLPQGPAEETSPVTLAGNDRKGATLAWQHAATNQMPSVLHVAMFPRLQLTHIRGCAG